ncbi:MAG: thioredoxin [Parcubacteria group bacterium]|nr:MAG: thioredoxin [Parcubacteria group bacterium]
MPIELNDQNFQEQIKDFRGVALVDFWAVWCGPCKMQGPIVEELAKELAGNSKIRIAKVNVDENQVTANEHEIMSIPTLKIFKNGQPVEELIGLQNKDALLKIINKHLA